MPDYAASKAFKSGINELCDWSIAVVDEAMQRASLIKVEGVCKIVIADKGHGGSPRQHRYEPLKYALINLHVYFRITSCGEVSDSFKSTIPMQLQLSRSILRALRVANIIGQHVSVTIKAQGNAIIQVIRTTLRLWDDVMTLNLDAAESVAHTTASSTLAQRFHSSSRREWHVLLGDLRSLLVGRTSRIMRRRAGGVDDTTDAIRAVAGIRFV